MSDSLVNTGEKSRRLVRELREEMDDVDSKFIRFDDILYRKLYKWMSYAMMVHKTTKVKYSFPLINTMGEYILDPRIFQVVEVKFSEGVCRRPYDLNLTRDNERILKFDTYSDFKDDDMMYVYAYIAPVQDDMISETMDPIIDESYYEYLKEYVLTEYRNIKKYEYRWRKKESIDADVSALAERQGKAYHTLMRPFKSFTNF